MGDSRICRRGFPEVYSSTVVVHGVLARRKFVQYATPTFHINFALVMKYILHATQDSPKEV